MDSSRKRPSGHFQTVLVLCGMLILATGLTSCSKSPTEPNAAQKKPDVSELPDGALSPSQAPQTLTNTCFYGDHNNSAALYRICIPPVWNGDLVIYAHGFVAPDEPLEIHDDEVGG